MKKYDVIEKKFSELKNNIKIPRFQRGLVWNETKRIEFIKTLKEGLPIGVLLLAENKSDNDKEEFLVIDGLQRFTTMRDYSNHPFNYLDAVEISDTDIVSIIYASSSMSSVYDKFADDEKEKLFSSIRSIIINSVTNTGDKNLNDITMSIVDKLIEEEPSFNQKEFRTIHSTVYTIIERFSKESNIDDVVIPIILFKGETTELASIFQKLNQEGVKLTKYDVFAATWNDYTITVKDSAFIKLITAKYKAAEEDSDLEISDFDEDEMVDTGNLTVFEYAFGIGKAIGKKCKKLLPNVKDDKVDSIGFVILAEIFGLSYGKMSNLCEAIKKMPNLDYKELKNKIIETAYEIEECLDYYIKSPTSNNSTLACHAELQLVSYIVVLFKLKYKIEAQKIISRGTETSSQVSSFKRYLHAHYINDIIRGNWAGAGDKRLLEITKNPDICLYIMNVDKEGFKQAASDWIRHQNVEIRSKTLSKQNKLFLNYILRSRVNITPGTKYDVEHCVPVKVLESQLDKNAPIPISSICNTVYIPAPENRSKKDKTYYQKIESGDTAYTLSEEQLKKYLYPSREKLRFAESKETLSVKNYMDFLDERVNMYIDAIVNALYPES